MQEDDAGVRWLVLVYQFPKGPDSRRVKVWRRLQSIGAVAIKNSVYVLPLNDQSREDFEWLLKELQASGADGAILESRFVGGLGNAQLRDLFNAARTADYRALCDEVGAALGSAKKADEKDAQAANRQLLNRARKRLAEIEAIDFFGADAHDEAETGMRELARRTDDSAAGENVEESAMAIAELEALKNRVWVTRRGVRVDRIASAWLIRRWIDNGARFKFVAGKDYEPADREVRFDMFEAEFTHEGNLCTFEVLARFARKDDAALRAVADIVHDIDLKESKYDRPETAGIANLLAGIVAGTDDDEQRIERGSALFEDLYRFFDELRQ